MGTRLDQGASQLVFRCAALSRCFRRQHGRSCQHRSVLLNGCAEGVVRASLRTQYSRPLETERHNTIRSRNARFVALRSFLHFAARKEPAAQGTIQSVLALPMKRFERPLLGHLTREEIEAMLDAPEGNTWCGQRDRVMLATLYNTGARVSERISLTIRDVVLERSSCVHLHGKGRKQRTVPLWRTTASLLRDWLRSHRRAADQPLFPTARAAP
jgi:integrase/recombinase XerD